MIYYLKILALGCRERVSLSKEEFDAAVEANRTLIQFVSFTENYRVVLESYKRLEKAKHEVELDRIVYGFGSTYSQALDDLVLINSAALAYLSSARYFLDFSDKLLPKLLGDMHFDDFVAFRSSIYNACAEYRFIEALRNYVQHRGLPVDRIKYRDFVEDVNNIDSSCLVTALSLLIHRSDLEKDPKFKKKALSNLPEEIDIIKCIRFHMSGLWKMHNYVLNSHHSVAEAARNFVCRQMERIGGKPNECLVGLYAIAASDDGVIQAKVPLFTGWDDARRDALRRIGNLQNLHRRYISGKVQAEETSQLPDMPDGDADT